MIQPHEYAMLQALQQTDPSLYDICHSSALEHYRTLSAASHEIKNYISFINSSYQLITRQHPEAKTYSFWKEIGDTVHRLINFMDRTSLYRYCISPELAPTSLTDLLLQLPDEADDRHENSDRMFTFDIGSSDIQVSGDPEHLLIALNEIIDNCYDATPNNSDIHIAARLDEDSSHVRVIISNPGILPDINYIDIDDPFSEPVCYPNTTADILCKPFYSTRENRAGLGLSIVYRVCIAHYGTVSFQQDSDTTSVCLTLPTL